ncbi:Protein of unknown function DUF1752, fungi [Phaffia rhodozyma]|uniref:Nitrogen regulatory protein areA GATA-like domain-containing protein n=1 Tax=Phaffia rhodozyma TaxID=264483 RepID=A0A0F7SGR9_PHARH|nr:Protein of unknown function DUF1752, fungi [Phaffia rhodozyma]
MLSPSPLLQPVLSLALPAIQDVKGGEGLSSLWNVFTKCKDNIEQGDRLENISWSETVFLLPSPLL